MSMLVLVQSARAAAASAVVFHWWSVVVSALLFLNVVIMPLKAYISEPFPWTLTLQESTSGCTSNFTACEASLLSVFRARSRSMPKGTNYVFGSTFDLVRVPLTIGTQSNDGASFLLQTMYGQFYSTRVRREILEVGAHRRNASDFHALQISRMAGVVAAYTVFWTDVSSAENASQIHLYVGLHLPSYSAAWHWCKFIGRCCMAGVLARLMWRRYYQHFVHLAKSLRRVGLPNTAPKQRYYVLVGDPTSLVLLEPSLCCLFICDFFASSDFASRALVRICQTHDWVAFLTASLYLSRTVWCGYASMAVVSKVLQKYPSIAFKPVDPGILAVAVFIAAGLWLIIIIYATMGSCLLSERGQEEGTEGLLGAVFFVAVFASFPLLYGFGMPLLCRYWRRVQVAPGPRVAVTTMSSHLGGAYDTNDAKHRWLLRVNLLVFRALIKTSGIQSTGGSLNALFATDACYKRYRGISQTGADAYILYAATSADASNGRWTSVRLGLLSCAHTLPMMCDATKMPPACAVGWLELHPSLQLNRGVDSSPWTM
ncbi:hypothetical protein SPRG_11988 [Saprolegnia parasitica CBS 223.65]|uniref:Uncharacterized protein n=1 Tax=Saprolegnia parasitica (strain CBS 223.65) TaxID=695850 RepID=A0A067C8I6_SAPPC|nr:hypothetical protein SPRG_11988 [Saprolegnia parasitica CBS 223.65]KDO22851.1 hypothetical protein SPRG_11988 [Saprolegnia parasitica CBS 223.65]|eukprot:XP_012206408.1 hypothetical protein SPRG_11988 [Saprolegnia parasitica CBS 223.65]